ncbi:ATP-dependent DNA helicase RecG [Rhodovastum atsumiense]|uniref:Probable DNA 3'-5' helicase RecG n=1 Tax=Rhodovastum atsumiense TaxID=504468 RepID=A0A5M6ILZ4_9PROT|nr:ATP-dependent DNA helicase RecG [Rhodovastum atsumiense]KAA5609303.1 ATP-dependent DNA helicase RecG [Rhodovastum atsumiense]CAH2604616.1 ATP-dependent DNA helicase RecG [Rhodovastum atsumiense]
MQPPSPIPSSLCAPLFEPLTALRGVGEQVASLIGRAAGGARVIDLLFHLPESWIDRRARIAIRDAVPGALVTIEAEVVRIDKPASPRQPTRVVVRDGSGAADLVFFRRFPEAKLARGARVLVSGKFDDRGQMVHPDHVVPAGQEAALPWIEPVWPLTAGLFAWNLRKPVADALTRIPALPEWHDPALLRREGWPDFAAALRMLHAPEVPPPPAARRRLAYDELLAGQLALAFVRRRARERPGRGLSGDGALRAEALARFGHVPTAEQQAVLAEIDADLAAPRRMLRLLQGDVGSGKTLVAVLAMLRAVEAGAQAAMMAPTEILARQHFRTLERICPVPCALLTGSVTGKARTRLLEGLADGSVPVVVGTHALVQDSVTFRDLGLAVIDEQHRFGVEQRLRMGAKGEAADVLVMTATPIPRTLLLTQWGEMQVSRLTGKPAGRQPVRTTLHSLATLPDLVDAIGRALAGGARVYWVCPMVAESEVLDLAAAEERFAGLRGRFGDMVGLAHGRQDAAVREAALADFAAGRTRLLVATTVIEVGVDVPEASVMVIEHAERFGLAPLHQLRGRVGRGREASFCLLLHADGLAEPARRRLTLLRDTGDGFRIADEDFRIRGGGDLLGTKQAGLPGWRLADAEAHEDLLHMAARDAEVLAQRDPELRSERGEAARVLLHLFEKRAAFRTLRAG